MLLTYDIRAEFNDGEKYFTYNFDSLYNIIFTLLLLQNFENIPDIFLNPRLSTSIVQIVIIFCTLFNVYILQGMLLASVNEAYVSEIDSELFAEITVNQEVKR